MKILLVHNYYGDRSQVGGEAMVVRNEAELLRCHGHTVMVYERENWEFMTLPLFSKLRRLNQFGWSVFAQREIVPILEQFQPDVMHVHNYKFMLTPSIFEVAKKRNIRTVITLHNYRLMVPCGNYMNRHGEICTRCEDGRFQRYLWMGCTGVKWPNRMMQYCAFRGGLRGEHLSRWVDCYITLTEFAKRKLIGCGVPAKRIRVKPNMVPVAPAVATLNDKRYGAVCIGRISPEKGIEFLLRAWRGVAYPLMMIGDGPLRVALQRKYSSDQIRWMGTLENGDVRQYLRQTAFMVFPSTCYEGQPLTILEALASGTPVVAADLPPRREMIADGCDGMLYEYGNVDSCRKKIQEMIALPDDRRRQMGDYGKNVFQTNYTAERNYQLLSAIYEC